MTTEEVEKNEEFKVECFAYGKVYIFTEGNDGYE